MCVVLYKTKVVRIIFAFFYFSFSRSRSLSLFLVKDFLVTIQPRIFKCTTIRHDKLYCVLKNQLCIT